MAPVVRVPATHIAATGPDPNRSFIAPCGAELPARNPARAGRNCPTPVIEGASFLRSFVRPFRARRDFGCTGEKRTIGDCSCVTREGLVDLSLRGKDCPGSARVDFYSLASEGGALTLQHHLSDMRAIAAAGKRRVFGNCPHGSGNGSKPCVISAPELGRLP
jgi:hypothetical protein